MAAVRPAGDRPDDTRERIIEAAQDIFARDGFVGAKMQEIADRVGIQRPSLFYHFKNKEALFAAAHERVFARIEPIFRESLVPDGDPFEQLDRVTRAVLAIMGKEPEFARMVARTAVDRHPAALHAVRGHVQPLIDLSVEFLRRHQRRGVFRADADPFFFTLNSWGAALIYFTARDLLTPAPARSAAEDRERFTRSLLQMGNRALAPSERRSPAAKRSEGRARSTPTGGRKAARGRD
ncbi:MAG TPA: TetR/AcrR family transcriptional regulator [Candidatus Binatia bacterium]|nr:TetR/AcrR family transcriptional regulator [Candidatus Binatia bacterium]